MHFPKKMSIYQVDWLRSTLHQLIAICRPVGYLVWPTTIYTKPTKGVQGKMKVIKIGGGCLNGNGTIQTIMDLLSERGKGNVVVVSALNGITDFLIEGMRQSLDDEAHIPDVMASYRSTHMAVARHLINDKNTLRRNHLYRKLIGLYQGDY